MVIDPLRPSLQPVALVDLPTSKDDGPEITGETTALVRPDLTASLLRALLAAFRSAFDKGGSRDVDVVLSSDKGRASESEFDCWTADVRGGTCSVFVVAVVGGGGGGGGTRREPTEGVLLTDKDPIPSIDVLPAAAPPPPAAPWPRKASPSLPSSSITPKTNSSKLASSSTNAR